MLKQKSEMFGTAAKPAQRLNSSVFKSLHFSTSRSQHPDSNDFRRDALRSTLSFAGATFLLSRHPRAHGFISPNSRPRIGVVGAGSRWYIRATGIDADYGSAPQMRQFGDYVAICDVDSRRRESAEKS